MNTANYPGNDEWKQSLPGAPINKPPVPHNG